MDLDEEAEAEEEPAPPGRRKTRREGRRQRGLHTDKQWAIRVTHTHTHLQDMPMSIRRLTLMNAQNIRILSAATLDALTMPKDHPVVQARSSELENYKRQSRSSQDRWSR